MKCANIILGSYVNGYSIVQELDENKIDCIYILDTHKDVACYSNKIKKFIKIRNNKESIYSVLLDLSTKYNYLILYPNQDIFVQFINELYSRISNFCFIAFNPLNATKYQDKMVQYNFCKKLGIPYPNVVLINDEKNINKILNLKFPIIIKPTKRDNYSYDIFRNILLNNRIDYEKKINIIKRLIIKGYRFIASEVIPGNDSNIYAYTAYRTNNGKILGEWTGKKLSQFPNNFGVFASSSNECPEIVIDQGRKLLHNMDLHGINQPEFKFDYRDRKYKLMEINLRPMMWHRLGALSGVPLNYIQYLFATKQNISQFKQDRKKNIHYIYLNHELINLVYRKKYIKIFINNVFGGDKRQLALWELKDLKPFLYSFISIFKRYIKYFKRGKNVIN